MIDAHADRDEAKAAKASREHDKADRTTLRDAAERLEGARRAVAKAEAERGLYAAENVDVLIAERAPDARAGAAAVEQAVEQLGRAYAQWTGVESDVASLLRAAGRNTGTLPRFPFDDVMRAVRRVSGVRVPASLPGESAYVTVAPHDDPDPAVRKAPRTKITREAA